MGIRFFLVARKTPPHAPHLFPSDCAFSLGCPYMPEKEKNFHGQKAVRKWQLAIGKN
jgi:hypothetical protein